MHARTSTGVRSSTFKSPSRWVASLNQVTPYMTLRLKGRITGPLQSGEMLLQQCNDKVDDIARKTIDIHQIMIISQGAGSKDIEPLEPEVARSNRYKGQSSEENIQTENRIPGDAHRTIGSEDSHISMKEEKLHRPASPFEADKDAEDLLRPLNALIEQISCFIADSLCDRGSSISSKELEDVLNELICYIGPWLCDELRSKLSTKPANDRLMITQLVLQSGLVNACSHIINHGFPPSNDTTLSRTHRDTVETGQAVADTQKAQPPTYIATSQSECYEVNQRYLTRIALQLITAVGGSLESGGALPPRQSDVLDEIVKKSLKLHKAISEAATSMNLVTYTIPPSTDFDHSQMENTEEGGNETTQDTVICTLEMGLRCRKRNENSSEEWDLAIKTKVILASTLDV
ncbi:hypothetical protein M378DRAFT_18793 [Amanita muscaria Koide BX008]|uniref:Uncharacterized protein n=1 Tax=Amanita muscaria (strain Koide BX008) TaxID=946122 RepID=A0A0C2W0D1_AMAMK|nr:hypothetical protein M378DRAFT_18793 [Amanita muscaria Koide BX008]